MREMKTRTVKTKKHFLMRKQFETQGNDSQGNSLVVANIDRPSTSNPNLAQGRVGRAPSWLDDYGHNQ